MRAILTVTGGPQDGCQWTLAPDAAQTLGRSDDADVTITDAEASRFHCTISFNDGRWFIQDNKSLNGVRVNGDQVGLTALHDGDEIGIGATTLRIEIWAEPGAKAGRPASEAASGPPEEEAAPADRAEQVEPETPAPAARRFGPPRIVRVETETTIQKFIERHPHDTSNIVMARRQKLWYLAIVSALTLLVLRDHLWFLRLVHVLCTFYLVVIGYKLVSVCLSFVWRWEIRCKLGDLAALNDADLPFYTILVPLYKETEVVTKVVRHIAELDYPSDKLDVKILLEPDDPETLAALETTGLPQFCEVVVCPKSLPKTKPKACNHGLARACGEYVVIYDAEDRPEPDQLKKAVVAFHETQRRWDRFRWLRRLNPLARAGRGRTVCLQAKLNYYNPRQNLLTRWFTIEYATWFQLYLPGLHGLKAPIPLGGTSNHFRADVLKEIGGWDPFNVTEDCDLGIRLHKLGHRTEVLDSTTWEEANSRLGNWLRQRSRWVKGYVQTHLTHMRHPLRTLWRLRPWGMFNFMNSVGGLSVMLLLNPIFWASTLLFAGLFAVDLHQHGYSFEKALGVHEAFQDAADRVASRETVHIPQRDRWAWPMIGTDLPDALPDNATWTKKLGLAIQADWRGTWRDAWGSGRGVAWNRASHVFLLCTLTLVLGNLLFVIIHVLACLRARMPGMIPYAILTPFYWVLISVGAWKGVLQLIRRPFYWEKTRHGLDSGGTPSP